MGFQQGLSGLSAASKQLDVIGNNIANGSTIGFKGSRVEFGDLYARSLASASTQAGTNTQAGVGVQVLAVSQQFQQGNITTTNNPLDMAISGNGFYRLTSENTGNGGIEAFSRNGEFKLDKEGYIVNNGYYLNGYQIVNGVKTGAEQPLQVSTINSGIAKATGAVGERGIDWSFNLNGGAAEIDPAVKPFDPLDASTYSYTSGAKFYDNYGNVHTVSVYFARRASTTDPVVPATVPPSTLDVNNWDVYHSVDGTLVAGAPTQVKFDQSGQLTAWSDNIITIAADTSAASAHPAFDIDFTNSTQYSGDYSVTRQVAGGYPAGKFTGIGADSAGVIYANYNNGVTEPIGQITLYNFSNIQGLVPNGNNRWLYSSDAGARSMADPNSGGMGYIKPSALEESNVDTTTELVNMIVAQRYYQANAQTIKTQDTIMQTLLNLR